MTKRIHTLLGLDQFRT